MIKNDNRMFFKRKKQNRIPGKKILIITEGEKTEINYFKGFINDLNLTGIELRHENPTPDKVVETALCLYERGEKKGSQYTAVYCVMDRDIHPTFKEALETIKDRQAKGIAIYAVVSIPSFEYWFLLHFQYSTKAYEATVKCSAGDLVVRDLNKLMKKKIGSEYKKEDTAIYDKLKPYLLEAEKRAESIERHDIDAKSYNPYTNVYKLTKCFSNGFKTEIKIPIPNIDEVCERK